MLFSTTTIAAATVLAASVVNGHMIMRNPVPYSTSSLNNSPLAADGSDFPCKLRADTYTVVEMNNMTIGAPQTLDFTGSATHGGGSCQISLTTDLEPTSSSKWEVIHSIEGGCPANVAGNLAANPSGTGASTFTFSIPEGVSEGKYTLAWTWFNRIGNREMYMNCAPITVTSGSSSKRDVTEEKSVSKRTSFPDMFKANINGCTTPESVDIRFPNPGDSVEYAGTPSNLQPVGQAACTGGPGEGATGSSPSATSASAPAASTSATVTTSAAATLTGAPGVFANSASSAVPTVTSTPDTPASASAPAAAPSSSGSASSSGALSGACSTEGEWNCIGGSSFQRCASGVWSSAQSMAAGTTCTAGQSTDLKIAAVKRSGVSKLHSRRRVYLPSQLE